MSLNTIISSSIHKMAASFELSLRTIGYKSIGDQCREDAWEKGH
jgi:hypothetical protein